MPTIPVSTGELLDRMSILEIKMQLLPKNKVVECQHEYDQIAIDICHPDHQYYYNLLLRVNNNIWDLQNRLHHDIGNPVVDYPAILDLNDQRFKIKQKINRLVNSDLNEQKDYGERKCVVYGHLGMGDMYWMNGAVRFLSTIYDEVIVVVKNRNLNNTSFMYSNDQTIKTFPIEKDIPIKDIELKFPEHKIFSCGIHINKSAHNYPHSFYLDMDIDPSIRTEYFNHTISLESKDLYNKIEEEYVLVHDSKSTSNIDFNNILDIDKILTLNINKNMYHKDHKYYKIASEFVDLPLYYYIDTIKNAKELHLIESSLACLAVHLDLQKVKTKKTYQSSNNFINLGIFK